MIMLGHSHGSTEVFLYIYLYSTKSAHFLFKWCFRPDNSDSVSTFATSLLNDLSSVLDQDNCKNMITKKESVGKIPLHQDVRAI